jgi:hypothetical protein
MPGDTQTTVEIILRSKAGTSRSYGSCTNVTANGIDILILQQRRLIQRILDPGRLPVRRAGRSPSWVRRLSGNCARRKQAELAAMAERLESSTTVEAPRLKL